MPDLSAWRMSNRAHDAWRRISEKPSSVVLKRGATLLPAQTVRVEANSLPSEVEGPAGISSIMRVTLFGVRGHESVADTNIQRGDVFGLNGTRYRVVHVIHQTGEVQASCEAMQ